MEKLPQIQLLLLKDGFTIPDWAFLFFNLPNDQPQTAGTEKPFISIPQLDKIDVHFNMDTTGSMGGGDCQPPIGTHGSNHD